MKPASALPEVPRAQPLMGLGALVYLYRRRLRVHAVQELLAGVGVMVAVALVCATLVAAASIAGSARQVVRAVTGPATLQLHARSAEGFPESLVQRVKRLPGVTRDGALLEQAATVQAGRSGSIAVTLAGANLQTAILDGLMQTLPRATLSSDGIGLSRRSARDLHITPAQVAAGEAYVTLKLRGGAFRLPVSTVLGPEAFGALSQAPVAVMRLERLQRLAGLPGRITRVLVQTAPGAEAGVGRELLRLSADRLDVARADQDVALLRQALRPSDQASALFAWISALLGVLLAFTALLLTVPERRRAIADLRLIGTRRSAIAQMVLFQALCLGLGASLLGLGCGYLISRGLLHQSPRYLAQAFTLGSDTVVGVRPLALAFGGGMLAACLASTAPLLDLRKGRVLDAIHRERQASGNALPPPVQRGLSLLAGGLLTATAVLFAASPARALLACVLLALATVLITPLAFAGVLWGARTLTRHMDRLTILPVALSSLRATPLRSIALAATGAVALFGSVALGGARGDLLRGVQRLAHDYSADADVWVGNPGDNQATVQLRAGDLARRIGRLPGVEHVSAFQGGFAQVGARRVWLIARPPAAARHVLQAQVLQGKPEAALARLSQPGWIAASSAVAREQHERVGGRLTLPTPSGPARLRIAALTTNIAWSPGTVLMSSVDYRRLWRTSAPTALGVRVRPGASIARVQAEILTLLGPASGLQAVSAQARERSVDALTSEGLKQIGQISMLLLVAAVLAMAAALASAIWQRRASLAGLRLAGVRPRRLRLILLTESTLMLGTGCAAGALAGVYGQLIIDAYLRQITGFPVLTLATSLRPLEIFALVSAAVLAIVATPGWLASRVPPTLAFNE